MLSAAARAEHRLPMATAYKCNLGAPLQVLWILALAMAEQGCARVELEGRAGHIPVLLGPVACIGCGPSTARAPNAQPFDVEVSNTITGISGNSGGVFFNSGQDATMGQAADASVYNLCTGEIRLHTIKASVFHIDALAYSRESYYIGVKGHVVAVPAGVCDPRLGLRPNAGGLGVPYETVSP
jgi:hypothetical protein